MGRVLNQVAKWEQYTYVQPVLGPAPPAPPAPNPPLVNYTFPIINASDIKEINTDIGGKKIPFRVYQLLNDLSSNNTTFNQSLQALTTITESLGGEVIYTYNSSIPRICI